MVGELPQSVEVWHTTINAVLEASFQCVAAIDKPEVVAVRPEALAVVKSKHAVIIRTKIVALGSDC